MTRKYKTAQRWAAQVPGVRALILLTNTGARVVWKTTEPAPEGLFTMIGVLE